MEIAVWVVVPNGIISDDLVADPDTEVFFSEEDAEDAARETSPYAEVFTATVTLYADDFTKF